MDSDQETAGPAPQTPAGSGHHGGRSPAAVSPGAEQTIFFQTADDEVGTARGLRLEPHLRRVLTVRTDDGVDTYAVAGDGRFFTWQRPGHDQDGILTVRSWNGWERSYSARYWLMIETCPPPPARRP